MALLKLTIGGGLSSFYVAAHEALASQLKIHIYDRLWAPLGLVRYGVAPDHPEVKVGSQTCPTISHALHISLSTLKPHYTHLLLSTGCTVPTLHPAMPHPTASSSRSRSSTAPPLHQTEHMSVIGRGNLTLDVARILLTPPNILDNYDVQTSVLDVLHRSAIGHVSIIRRRGPLQEAFTTKELRELTTLPGASMVPLAPELSLDFSVTPDGGHLTFTHTAFDERAHAVLTGTASLLRTDLVVTALGHHADPQLAPTHYDPAPGHLRAERRRVLDASGRAVRRVYASGWAATGARGVLAATMIDVYVAADAILADHFPGRDGLGAVAPPVHSDDVLVLDDVDLESVPREIEERA
ncbi:hypothetical protein BC827DRAFT_1260872 [Russula dissimulans]|nr:hypothetical protein BC827DRAFT_1260872 [Russula dissimulans]